MLSSWSIHLDTQCCVGRYRTCTFYRQLLSVLLSMNSNDDTCWIRRSSRCIFFHMCNNLWIEVKQIWCYKNFHCILSQRTSMWYGYPLSIPSMVADGMVFILMIFKRFMIGKMFPNFISAIYVKRLIWSTETIKQF